MPALRDRSEEARLHAAQSGERLSRDRRPRSRARMSRRERRDCARPPAADPAIVPPHVDRAHPAAAGTHRERARDLSGRGRSRAGAHATPKAWCSRCGCSATRSSASRGTRRRCRVSRRRRSCSRSWRTACSEAEMRSGVARILERTSPDEAAQAWSAVLTLQRTARRLAEASSTRAKGSRARRARGADDADSARSNRRWRSRPRSASARARLRFATRSASSSGSAAATPRR